MRRQAVVAGYVGIGVALILVLSFELIFAVQAIVFLLALPAGLLIGYYANSRDAAGGSPAGAARAGGPATLVRLGWGRIAANGAIAGAMTALALAGVYVSIRFLFLYLDTGFRAGGPPYSCMTGPDCAYSRSLDDPTMRQALAEAGIDSAEEFDAYFRDGQMLGGASLVALVMVGAAAGAGLYGAARPRGDAVPAG